MMFGSIFYNCWGALIAFTIYFFATFQTYFPFRVLMGSFIVALIAFFAMFLVRYLIGYVTYTPDNELFGDSEIESDEMDNPIEQEEVYNNRVNVSSTVEFEDESSEEIAKVVRTMIHEDDTVTNNI